MNYEQYVTINPINGKWCVAVLVGQFESSDEAKKKAEEIGKAVGNALLGKK